MHEVIQHVGIVLCLDAWRVGAAEIINKKIETLNNFVKLQPTWEDLVKLAEHLCLNYVAAKTHVMIQNRRKSTNECDQQHENILLQHQYFLLYKEMSYAMNYGDIGCIESLFFPNPNHSFYIGAMCTPAKSLPEHAKITSCLVLNHDLNVRYI